MTPIRSRAFARALALALGSSCAAAAGCRTGRPQAAPAASSPPAATISQAVFLNGRPFPERPVFSSDLPPPARTFHVSARAADAGDGSASRPWKDLDSALRSLSPGDRLVVSEGEYPGGLRIDDRCPAGTEAAPIQVVFEKAVFKPSPAATPVLTVSRSFWRFEGFAAELGDAAAPAFVAEGAGARGITLDRARIVDGSGAAIRIGAGASRVTVANSSLFPSPRRRFAGDGSGIEIGDGTRDILVIGNLVTGRPDGAVRIGGAGGGEAPPEIAPPLRVIVSGNTLFDNRAPAIRVSRASGIQIRANTISRAEAVPLPAGRGIVIEWAADAVVEGNHVANSSLAIQVGWAEPPGTKYSRPVDVLVVRNFFESPGARDAAGIDVESGLNVRVCNNVFHDVADAILLFGAPPRTESVVVANNLVLSVSGTAFRMDDPSSAKLFDRNVFSPRGSSEGVAVEVGGRSMDLAKFLATGRMRETRLIPGARMIHKDLGRIEGVDTRDAGVSVTGVTFRGKAPDLGVSEQ